MLTNILVFIDVLDKKYKFNVIKNTWVWQQHFYQSMQPLNAFWLGIVFMAKDAAWIGNPDNPSVTLEIRKNM